MPDPLLTRRDVDGPPQGLVLMLHGGQPDSVEPVEDGSTSWRRSSWMMRQIAGRLSEAAISVWLLRYRMRGWNDEQASPVPDARSALDEVRRELGALPVVLLGHSMGGRVAVAVADDPSVTGVVALAPWLPVDEPVGPLSDKKLAAAHGRGDRITSAGQTRAFVRRAESVAASTEFTDMGRVGHYMLRRIPAWNDFAVSRSRAFVQQHAAP